MTSGVAQAQARHWAWTFLALALVLAFLAQYVRVGGDWDWLVAMGDHIRAVGAIPDGVPFAAADTGGWHNVPVLAELTASLVHDLSERGAVVAHLALVAATLVILGVAARARGASDAWTAGTLFLLGVGGLATFGVVRAQTLSLVPFALMVALVSAQARRPDRRIWWAVPLIAVWGNLHGAALLGVCLLGAYLVVQRLRADLLQGLAVGVASLLALCVTPELWRTPVYYAEVFDNVSAQRGEGLWARPSLSMPFDVLMLLAAIGLLIPLLRHRRQAWEYVAVLGLCAATVSSARHGVWLLCLLVVLAVPRSFPLAESKPDRAGGLLAAACGVIALVVALPIALTRGDSVLGAPPAVVSDVARVAQDRVVLAPAPLSESLAVAGVTLWVSNPLDAFTHPDQAAYLDFLDGTTGAGPAVAAADVVVAREGSRQASLMSGEPGFATAACGDDWVCWVRR